MNKKTISPELREQIRRDRQVIEAELPELEERQLRMDEAKQEETISRQLRRVIHGSGRLVREIVKGRKI